MSDETACPACGKPMKRMKMPFEMRMFVTRGGPNKGKLNFSIQPEGIEMQHCYTNEGCGETLTGMAEAKLLDKARVQVNAYCGFSLMELIGKIRAFTKL